VIAGRPASEASDIFSLGAVAYYLAVGHGPFAEAKSVAEALTLALTRDPQLPADVPEALVATIAACLGREPAGRPRSMQLLSERLRRAMEECEPWTAQDAERWWAAHPHPERAAQSPTMKTFVPVDRQVTSSLDRTES
jgi:serine/threonine-protein kinase